MAAENRSCPSSSRRGPVLREMLATISAVVNSQREMLATISADVKAQLEMLQGKNGVISRLAVLEEKAREVSKLRERAFVTAKDGLIAAVSAAVTAAAMYFLGML